MSVAIVDEAKTNRFSVAMTMQQENELASLLDDAVDAWKAGRGDTDAWARGVLRSLVAGELTPEQVANAVYKRIAPRDARGALAQPKNKNGRLSVRNIENSTAPAVGAASARKNLETLLTVYYERDLIRAEIDAFCAGQKGRKFYGLLAELKKRTKVERPTMELSLPPELRHFVLELVDRGEFLSADEVVSTALEFFRQRIAQRSLD